MNWERTRIKRVIEKTTSSHRKDVEECVEDEDVHNIK